MSHPSCSHLGIWSDGLGVLSLLWAHSPTLKPRHVSGAFFVIFPRRTPATGPSLWVCERTDHGTNSTDPIWGRARGGCHPASHLRRCRLPWPRRPAGPFFTSRESKGSAPAHW